MRPVLLVSIGFSIVASAVAGLVQGCCARSSSTSPTPVASTSATPEPPKLSRCSEPLNTFTLGEERGASEDDVLPFSVEVGDGTTYAGGFAIGALTVENRASAATVVTLGKNGENARKIVLGGAHGDTRPPRLTSKGDLLMVGLLDSESAGRRLRIGKIENDSVTWTSSFEQGRDESFAFDLAIGDKRAVAVWDDDGKGAGEQGVIRLATMASGTLLSPSLVRTVSLPQTDAESPEVVARAGGFWLMWVARRPEHTDDNAREPGEATQFRWLEVMQLDENGAPAGLPRRLTPTDGHVIAYTIRSSSDGSAVVIFRDDDTPSGSSGGTLSRIVVRPDGTVAEPLLLTESSLGVGAPSFLAGWLAIADATTETRLARVAPNGELIGSLAAEPILGRGEPLAALGDLLLVSRPRGASVRLFVTRCGDQPLAIPSTSSSEIALPTAPPALPLPELPSMPPSPAPAATDPLPQGD